MIEVIAASSISILREGVRHILTDHADIEVSGEIARAEDALLDHAGIGDKIVLIVAPLICDGRDDFYLRLRVERPGYQIVTIPVSDSADQILAAIHAGSRGILSRCGDKAELPVAVRAVRSGKIYLGKEIAIVISTELSQPQVAEGVSPLTARELQVIKRIAIGRKQSTIAEELGISVKTVSAHKANILLKLALTSESNLVLYAIENKLFDLFVDHSGRKAADPDAGGTPRRARSR